MADEQNIWDTLNLQLSEVEILTSMFITEKELKIDQTSLIEIQDYVCRKTQTPPKQLSLTLYLTSENTDIEKVQILQVCCSLPCKYPEKLPEVYARCDSLSRELQKELNIEIRSFLERLDPGELCVVTLFQWLKETWFDFSKKCTLTIKDEKGEEESVKEEKITRLWLYMHHIYSKTKRKHILDWAEEGSLTGFSLPGKPGVVCVEGCARDTEEYFSRLRRLNWKKITCRHREPNVDRRSFKGFQELVLRVQGSADDRMDMGEFFQYLVEHNLAPMFKILFGIEGK